MRKTVARIKKTITIEGKNYAVGASFYGEKVVSSGIENGQINISNITGNWNLFYADKDNAYLIYYDYYHTLSNSKRKRWYSVKKYLPQN